MHIYQKPPNFGNLEIINPNLKAVIWDMDGTILDSEKFHIKATSELLKKHHIELTTKEVEKVVLGQIDQIIHEYFCKNYPNLNLSLADFIHQKDELIISLIDEKTIMLPEIKNIIKTISSSSYKQALVTSSEKKLAMALLKKLNLITFFDIILTREDTEKNKPHPMPYQTAFQLLQIKSHESIIFEDSEIGFESAKRSEGLAVKAKWY